MEPRKEIAIRDDKVVALQELETRFAMAVKQRELLADYIKERLTPGKHFYKLDDEPGRKPSLTKEGAELICLPHALKAHYSWVSGPENPPIADTPYQITMKAELETNGNFAGEGIGSASSHQTKKDGSRVARQKDPGLGHNATIKMACKSAYIAATLNSTAASEFFTQDLEDDQTGDKKEKETKEHWCEKHKTNFFKSKKMKSYAHTIKGTDPVEWCDEPPEVVKFEKAGSDPSLETTLEATRPISSPSERQTGSEQPAEAWPNGIIWPDLAKLIEALRQADPKFTDSYIGDRLAKDYKVQADTVKEQCKALSQTDAKRFVGSVQLALLKAKKESQKEVQEGLDK